MAFTDNAKKVVIDAADTVVKASGAVIEKSKVKYAMYDAKIDIRRYYEELGQTVYAGYKSGEDCSEQVEEICAMIKEKEELIEELNEKSKAK